jgi:hypothetical protein
MRALRISIFLLPALLGGCVVLPVYKVQPDEAVATVDVSRLPDPAVCIDGVGYKPAPAGKDLVSIPADKRVSLYSSWYASDGYMSYYCTAGAAYTFAAGSKLVAAMEHDSLGCRVDLVQLVDDTPTGTRMDPTTGVAECNPWNPDGK